MDEDEKITDKALLRIKKRPVGYRSEDFVNYFLSPWFSGYWAFPKPKYKGGEIADSLLLWGDVAFLIEVKERKGIKSNTDWAKHKIAKDKTKILNWVESLKTEDSIILKNKYREIEFPREKIKNYYGLIVLNHLSESYDANEFLRDDSTEQKVAIQVISLADIFHLLRYINTPWDFVNYFESRFRLSQKTSVKVHQEKSVFGQNLPHMYHEMKHDIGKEQADDWNEFMDITIKAVNGDFQAGDPGLRRFASSFLIDSAIGGILYKAPRDRHGNFIIDDKFVSLIKSVEKLTELNRLIRAFWGERFIEKAERSLTSGNDEFVTGQSPNREICYGFIATNKTSKARERLIEKIARSILLKNNQLEGIFIAASPENIFSTFLMFVSWFSKNKKGILESNMMETLDSTLLFISHKG
jgi:hypothetical protein